MAREPGSAHIPLEHPYPVINLQPTFGAVMRNFGAGDYGQFIMGTLIGGVAGFAGGKPIRRQGSMFMAATTAFLCFTQSFRSSYHRLTGQRPNEAECASAGIPYVVTPP